MEKAIFKVAMAENFLKLLKLQVQDAVYKPTWIIIKINEKQRERERAMLNAPKGEKGSYYLQRSKD